MAYFCTETGVRIVSPGIAVSVSGGTVPVYDSSDPAHVVAEAAAATVLATEARSDKAPPSATIRADALAAALKAISDTPAAAPAGPDAPPPAGSPARLWFDRAHATREALDDAEARIRRMGSDLDVADGELATLRAQLAGTGTAATPPPAATTTTTTDPAPPPPDAAPAAPAASAASAPPAAAAVAPAVRPRRP